MSVGKENEGRVPATCLPKGVSPSPQNARARARSRPVKNILSRNIRARIGVGLRAPAGIFLTERNSRGSAGVGCVSIFLSYLLASPRHTPPPFRRRCARELSEMKK